MYSSYTVCYLSILIALLDRDWAQSGLPWIGQSGLGSWLCETKISQMSSGDFEDMFIKVGDSETRQGLE